ncbi:MAG: TIGR03013 family XrtA/PEP-CTERM system glycosyltransferase [Gammaproteobacteria bacterium]
MYRIFRHYIPKTLFMLGLAEALILLASVYVGAAFVMMIGDDGGELISGRQLHLQAALFALAMVAMMTAMGLYQRDSREGPKAQLLRLVLSFAGGLIAIFCIWLMSPQLFIGGRAFGAALVASFVGIASCRFLCVPRTDTRLSRRVLVLGVGHRALQISSLRRRSDRHGVTIVGFVDIGSEPVVVQGRKIFAAGDSLYELAAKYDVDEIVVAMDERRKCLPLHQVLECKMHGIRVIDEGSYLERQLGKIRLDALQPSSLVFGDGFTQAVLKPYSKRLFDIVVSLVLLVLVAPLMILTALAIYWESRGKGSIFYSQERVGQGKIFRVYKFRSMREDAEKNGAVWAKKDDDRVTRVGKFIRKTRIDELPQLYNVLRGDMSFVGPRPERPHFVQQLANEIPYFELRHHVKPGITGWAQVCYPYGASVDDAREKLQYDLYYLKNYSLFLDIMIIVQTLQVVIWGKGSR